MNRHVLFSSLVTIVTVIGMGCGGSPDEMEPEIGSTTHAAVGCYGTGCNGQDPIAMGCSADARTVAGPVNVDTMPGLHLGTVELRYSPACAARWPKFYNNTGGATGSTYLKNSSGKINNTVYTSAAAQIYGNMNGGVVRACAVIENWSPYCTNSY